jgi:hypothetical protein
VLRAALQAGQRDTPALLAAVWFVVVCAQGLAAPYLAVCSAPEDTTVRSQRRICLLTILREKRC